MEMDPKTTSLPKRTPDPAHTLAGAYQHLLHEYIAVINRILPLLPSKALRGEIINHTAVVHTEALKVLMEVGERVEESSKQDT